MVIDYSAVSVRVERVLYLYGDVCLEYRVDCRRVYHLRTEVAKLGSLHIAQVAYGVGVVDYAWVGSHETVNVGPYLKAVCLQRGCQYGCGVVATATAKIGNLVVLLVLCNEARYHNHLLLGVVEVLVDEPVGLLVGKDVFAVLCLCLYEVAGVEACGTVNERGYYAARNPLAVAHDSSLRLWSEVVDERKTLVYVVQLIEQHVYLLQQVATSCVVGDYCIDEVVMACHNLLELLVEGVVAVDSHVCSLNELVGYAAQCRHHYNDLLL